ncbi:uncharacterized protein MKK02DRAFT_27944 [Dioszegia hungarica]|uniref:DUF7721 domain-containing protein n=1 Tax=Dioszegia hungarica TaxID=4972 RepID=A0AA38H5B9_9TREE|nr:uncharacterized protein MKK02DRAFT_27944 [Dioszegia hungarica]KAI9634802.1 hypothetical protein MKK02DRAFT_27944 [Dioszegia hungarica]
MYAQMPDDRHIQGCSARDTPSTQTPNITSAQYNPLPFLFYLQQSKRHTLQTALDKLREAQERQREIAYFQNISAGSMQGGGYYQQPQQGMMGGMGMNGMGMNGMNGMGMGGMGQMGINPMMQGGMGQMGMGGMGGMMPGQQMGMGGMGMMPGQMGMGMGGMGGQHMGGMAMPGGMGAMGAMGGMMGGNAWRNLDYGYTLPQLGYKPEAAWSPWDLATRAYTGERLERGFFDNIVSTLSSFFSNRHLSEEAARNAHRRVYHLNEGEDSGSKTLGGAAAYQAFLSWDRDHHSLYHSYPSSENRERLVALAVAELFRLWDAAQPRSSRASIEDAAQYAAATAKYLFDRVSL